MVLAIVIIVQAKANAVTVPNMDLTTNLEVTPNPYIFEDTYEYEKTSAMFIFSNTGDEVL